MKKPLLIVVDDDPQVLKAVARDIKSKYRKEYRILSTTSANEALATSEELKKKNETVAMFLSDQRMPEMLGVDFLEKTKPLFPEAKRVLLTAYSDTDAAIRAINEVQLDYYLMKPWDPPEEKLYPTISELLEEWQATYIPDFDGVKVVGFPFSPPAHQIKDYLAGNLLPYMWVDFNDASKSGELKSLYGIEEADLPAVIFPGGEVLKKPTINQVAEQLGRTPQASEELYDVAIIGAGPAGLAAAVYGGSEGLKTILIERRAPGGQAGTSSRIENYLGFPKGLSGAELSRRAISQATRFGIEFLSPQTVKKIEQNGVYKSVLLESGETVNTKSIVITTGVDYRKHPAQGLETFTGAGVYYGAATTEAISCKGEEIYIVGGGNSAGQAAVYLSNFANKVFIVIRKDSLTSTMSSYLIDQINDIENIVLLTHTEIIEGKGNERLESIVLKNNKTEEIEEKRTAAIFIFIGAKPYTDWLDEGILKNNRGFILTGKDLQSLPEFNPIWKRKREPLPLETSIPGIFAAGDVRAGAMNRVASAVGEGSMSISLVHQYLGEF